MNKRLLSCGIIFCISAGVVFTGCQNSTNNNTRAAKSKPAKEKQVWQIGVIASKTGDNKEVGLATIDGIKFAIDEINEEGGINGYEVTYLAMDDEANSAKALNSFSTLKDWGMDFLIGTTEAKATNEVATFADENQIFMLTPTVVENETLKNHPSLYGVFLSDKNLGADIADYVGESKLGQVAAIISERGNIETAAITRSFRQEATENEFSVVLDKRLDKDCDYQQIYAAVEKCKEFSADILFMPLDQQMTIDVFNAAKELEYEPNFVGMEEVGTLLEADIDKTITAKCIYAVTEANPGNQYKVTFSKNYRAKTGQLPTEEQAAGYDSVRILKAAIEEANLTPNGVSDETYTAIRNAMSTITYTGLIGLDTTWNEEGFAKKSLYSRTYFNTDTVDQ